MPGKFLKVFRMWLNFMFRRWTVLLKAICLSTGVNMPTIFCAIFMFLLLSNISGIFGLRPPTADYCTTLALALITFAVIQFNAVRTNGPLGYIKSLTQPLPILFPINVIGEVATPVSLSLRLFGNIMGGTVMMALFYGLLPKIVTLGIPVFLHGYLDLFAGAIQTYVFCMLSMVFINDKLPAD